VSPDDPRPAAGLEAEREVDLGRYWRAILARWWLVALCAALGVLVGYLVSVGGGDVYQARATVYLGQPISPSGGSQVQSLATNPTVVGQIVRSESVVAQVAEEVGVPRGRLRQGISTGTVSGNVARSGQTPLVTITVRGPWREESAAAANRLAAIVVDRVSTYADAKIANLEQLLEAQDGQLESLEGSVAEYEQAIAGGAGLSGAERLTLVGLLNAAQTERGNLVEQRARTALELELAESVERAQVLTEAAPREVAARGRRSSMVVGGVIGLVAGLLAALAWAPLRDRIARRTA
jgi:capsular polysaccharide biosynthesis protein